MSRCLVWCGGDVSGYLPVEYVVNGVKVTSILAPAALNSKFDYDLLVVIVPSTLFTKDHCSNYELLLKAKSRFKGYSMENSYEDANVHRLLEKGLSLFTVPHPGLARPLELSEKEGFVEIRRGKQRKYECSFNTTLNSTYRCLLEVCDDHDLKEVHFDLTHGTNVLVTALMLSGNILSVSRDLEARFWCAPILGRPEEKSTVEILDVTESSRVAKEILSGVIAWEKLDERILPVKYFIELGRRLGSKYKDVYGSLKGILSRSKELLWGLRSGQATVVHGQLSNLKGDLKASRGRFEDLLKREYPLNEVEVPRERCEEPAWIPVADVVISRTSKLVDRIHGRDNIETVKNILELYDKVQLYDKVICIGREWLIFLLLRRIKKEEEFVHIGSEQWSTMDRLLKKLGMKRLERGEELNEDERRLLGMLKIPKDDPMFSKFEEARSTRNKLMHGRLSIEEGLDIKIENGILFKRDEEKVRYPKIIKRDSIKEVSNGIIELLKKYST